MQIYMEDKLFNNLFFIVKWQKHQIKYLSLSLNSIK